MLRRLGLVFGVVVAGSAALGAGSQAVGAHVTAATAGSLPAAAAAAVPMFGTWGPVRTLSFPPASLNVQVNSMACPVPGDCVVGGSESNFVIEFWPFLVTEAKGAWKPVNLLSPHNEGNYYAGINSVSCAAAGECAAVGYAMAALNSKTDRGILVAERNAAWDLPQVVSGTRFGTVSCAGAECVAGGGHDSVTSETGGGAWVTPQALTGSGAFDGSVLGLSCPAAGDCAAVGGYGTGAPPADRAFTADLTGGVWGALTDVPVTTPNGRELNLVSCYAAGDCTATGYYVDASVNSHVLYVTEHGGTWNAPVTVPAFDKLPGATVTTLSCPTAAFCAAGGFYEPVRGGNQIPFVANEVNGTWSAERVPGLPITGTFTYGGIEVASVSCPKAGYCLAGGSYLKPVSGGVQIQGFLDSEVAGTWAPMQPVPGLAALNLQHFARVSAVSCPTVSFCGAAGFYTSPTIQGFVMNGSIVPAATRTSLALSTARIRYGHEQAERITVRVFASGAAAVPGGKVTVKAGSAVVCVITLSAGMGSCELTAKRLGAGSYKVSASYPQMLGFLASAAPAKLLTISK